MAEDLGVSLLSLDIEIPEQLEAADRLVKEHGDWSEDYLIPQVFVDWFFRGSFGDRSFLESSLFKCLLPKSCTWANGYLAYSLTVSAQAAEEVRREIPHVPRTMLQTL
jgi:hypothetical protein